MRKSASILFAGALALTASTVSNAASIQQTRSVTVYEKYDADGGDSIPPVWDINNTEFFRQRVQLAKATGFNAVWIIVEWNRLDPAPVAAGDVALTGCGEKPDDYQCIVERAFQVVRDEKVDVFVGLNYYGGGASPEFKSMVRQLPFGDGPAKLKRHARYLATLAARNGVTSQARFHFHTEGILAPLNDLRSHSDVQDDFRTYLMAVNPDLKFWNTRWKLGPGAAFESWDSVETYSLNDQKRPPIDGVHSLRMRDHVAWVNWKLRNTLANEEFGLRAAIRSKNPLALTGMHDWYVSMTPPDNDPTRSLLTHAIKGKPFDYYSAPYYDGASSDSQARFGESLKDYVEKLKKYNQGIPMVLGELGSQMCPGAQFCDPGGDEADYWAVPYRVERRQAQFLDAATAYLAENDIGFNVWNLSEFEIPGTSKQGKFGLYRATPSVLNASDQPRFKPSGCALRTRFGRTDRHLCVMMGAQKPGTSPRTIWVTGRNFDDASRVRLYPTNVTKHAISANPAVNPSGSVLSFQLPDKFLGELGCTTGSHNCTFDLEVHDPVSGRSSNRIVIEAN